jgi:hypothetical protein
MSKHNIAWRYDFKVAWTTGILIGVLTAAAAQAAPFQQGNLLLSTGNVLYEVNIAGQIVQSIPIPYFGEQARDIALDGQGRVHVYNGTFDPVLSTYAPHTGTWEHRDSIAGWSTVNNGSYGGIDVAGNFVFLTDMDTSGKSQQGVVRYDLVTNSFTRFATNIEPIDLTIGEDGLLYALYPGGSPEGRFIDVFDPHTLAFVRTVSLASIFGHTGHRSIAVNSDGGMFIADWDAEVQKINSSGTVESQTVLLGDWIGSPIAASLQDIALGPAGHVAVGSRFGEIFITDTSLSGQYHFDVGADNVFVEFVPVPEPDATLWVGFLVLARSRVKHRGRIGRRRC